VHWTAQHWCKWLCNVHVANESIITCYSSWSFIMSIFSYENESMYGVPMYYENKQSETCRSTRLTMCSLTKTFQDSVWRVILIIWLFTVYKNSWLAVVKLNLWNKNKYQFILLISYNNMFLHCFNSSE